MSIISPRHRKVSLGALNRLRAMGNLTFFKKFDGSTGISADHSNGSPTATFTATRSATTPATYVDANGTIQLVTTSNIPRFQGGYYDATGFHAQKGLMIERASTNMLKDSYFADGTTTYWTASAGAVVTTTNERPQIYGSGNVLKIVVTGNNSGMLCAAANKPSLTSGTVYTITAYLRGTGNVQLYIGGSPAQVSSTITLQDSYWAKYSFTFTANRTLAEAFDILDVGDSDPTCYVAAVQIEALPYSTSFIPTTTAALTRNVENLSYVNSGNRTAATESIFIKWSTERSVSVVGGNGLLLNSDTKDRYFYIAPNTTHTVIIYPNGVDSVGSSATENTVKAANTSYVTAAILSSTGNPNATIYNNGSSVGSTNTDFTANAWGANFYVGCNSPSPFAAGNPVDGIIQEIAIFSDVKSATDVSTITTVINQ